MDETVLRPTEGVAEEQTGGGYVPWVDRDKRGFSRAWLGTIHMALFCPEGLARLLPAENSLKQALWFTLVSQIVFCTMEWPFVYMFLEGSMSAFIQRAGSARPAEVAFSLLMLPVTVSVVVAMSTLWACCAYVLLRLMGPVSGGWRDTIRAFYYSSGANIPAIVPCIGLAVGSVWWLVSAILMLETTHKVSAWRATVAVMMPPAGMVLGPMLIMLIRDSIP